MLKDQEDWNDQKCLGKWSVEYLISGDQYTCEADKIDEV